MKCIAAQDVFKNEGGTITIVWYALDVNTSITDRFIVLTSHKNKKPLSNFMGHFQHFFNQYHENECKSLETKYFFKAFLDDFKRFKSYKPTHFYSIGGPLKISRDCEILHLPFEYEILIRNGPFQDRLELHLKFSEAIEIIDHLIFEWNLSSLNNYNVEDHDSMVENLKTNILKGLKRYFSDYTHNKTLFIEGFECCFPEDGSLFTIKKDEGREDLSVFYG